MSGDDKPPRRLSDDDEALWHTITRSIEMMQSKISADTAAAAVC